MKCSVLPIIIDHSLWNHRCTWLLKLFHNFIGLLCLRCQSRVTLLPLRPLPSCLWYYGIPGSFQRNYRHYRYYRHICPPLQDAWIIDVKYLWDGFTMRTLRTAKVSVLNLWFSLFCARNVNVNVKYLSYLLFVFLMIRSDLSSITPCKSERCDYFYG